MYRYRISYMLAHQSQRGKCHCGILARSSAYTRSLLDATRWWHTPGSHSVTFVPHLLSSYYYKTLDTSLPHPFICKRYAYICLLLIRLDAGPVKYAPHYFACCGTEIPSPKKWRKVPDRDCFTLFQSLSVWIRGVDIPDNLSTSLVLHCCKGRSDYPRASNDVCLQLFSLSSPSLPSSNFQKKYIPTFIADRDWRKLSE